MPQASANSEPKRTVRSQDAQHIVSNLYNVLGFAYEIAPSLREEAWVSDELRGQLANVRKEIAGIITVLCWACEERDIDSSPLAVLATRWETLWRTYPETKEALCRLAEVLSPQESIDLLGRTCHRLLRKVELEIPSAQQDVVSVAINLKPDLNLTVEETRPGREVLVRRVGAGQEIQRAFIRGPSLVPYFLTVVRMSGDLKPTDRIPWDKINEGIAARKGWKGHLLSEGSLRDYGTRVKRALGEGGMADLWQQTPERGARFGPIK